MSFHSKDSQVGIKIHKEIQNLHFEFLEKFPISDAPQYCGKDEILIEFKNMFDFWWSKHRDIGGPNELQDKVKNDNDEINIAFNVNKQVEMRVLGLYDQLTEMGLKEEFNEFKKYHKD